MGFHSLSAFPTMIVERFGLLGLEVHVYQKPNGSVSRSENDCLDGEQNKAGSLRGWRGGKKYELELKVCSSS